MRGVLAARSTFAGFFAEFYDILHAGLEDVDAYRRFAEEFGPRVLELGSGTGRVLIPLARAGFSVTGVDASPDMMAICRERLGYEPEEVGSKATLVEGDVLALDLGARFDLVIAPCNFVNYFTGPGEALEMLQAARRHLSRGGTFLIDNGVPDLAYMRSIYGVTRRYEFEHPVTGTKLVYRVVARYDFVRQIETDEAALEERDAEDGGRVLRAATASETLVYYFPAQLRALLMEAGLEVFHEQGSLLEDIPVSDDGGEMVFLCRQRDDKD